MDTLIYAIRYSNTNSNIETVKILIDAGADINTKDNNGWTALTYASGYSNTDSNIETVTMLIDAGADIDTKDNTGVTALRVATINSDSHSNIETVKILIDAGADVNDTEFPILAMLLLRSNELEIHRKIFIQLLHICRKGLLDRNYNGKTAYDYYIIKDYNILDEYHLKILKGEININSTKSARLF